MTSKKRRFPRWLIRVGDFAVYLLMRVVVCVLQSLSLRGCEHLAFGLGFFLSDLLRVRASVVEDNLRHAFPGLSASQRQRLTREMWRHLVLMVCEIALAGRKVHTTNWRRHVRIENQAMVVSRFLSDRPLVAVTAHFGNFEMCGFLSGLLGFPTYTIARPLDNPYLHRFLSEFRGRTGQSILPTKGSADEAQAVLAAGETLALLGDHYGGPKGCWVHFFGRPASCHKAISLFSLANKAPLLVVYATRQRGMLQFTLVGDAVFDPLDPGSRLHSVPDVTQWYHDRLECAVRSAPHQYWWLHRRWKDPRMARRAAAPAAA